MKLLFVSSTGNSKFIESDILPRIGDKVDMFCYPYPTVNTVLLYPTDKTIASLRLSTAIGEIDAIVAVQ